MDLSCSRNGKSKGLRHYFKEMASQRATKPLYIIRTAFKTCTLIQNIEIYVVLVLQVKCSQQYQPSKKWYCTTAIGDEKRCLTLSEWGWGHITQTSVSSQLHCVSILSECDYIKAHAQEREQEQLTGAYSTSFSELTTYSNSNSLNSCVSNRLRSMSFDFRSSFPRFNLITKDTVYCWHLRRTLDQSSHKVNKSYAIHLAKAPGMLGNSFARCALYRHHLYINFFNKTDLSSIQKLTGTVRT